MAKLLRSLTITVSSTLLQACPPLCNALIISASQFPACAFLFSSSRQVPAVPHEGPVQDHASSMPGAAWSVNRLLPNSSCSNENSAVLTPFRISTLEQRFTCVRLLEQHLILIPYLFRNAHYHGSLPKQLTVVYNQFL